MTFPASLLVTPGMLDVASLLTGVDGAPVIGDSTAPIPISESCGIGEEPETLRFVLLYGVQVASRVIPAQTPYYFLPLRYSPSVHHT
jgi:hypothetical protein